MKLTFNQTLMLRRIRDGLSPYLGALSGGRNNMIGRDNTLNSLRHHKLVSRRGRIKLTTAGRREVAK